MALAVDYNVLKEILGPEQVLDRCTKAYSRAGKYARWLYNAACSRL